MKYKPAPFANQDRIGEHWLKTENGNYFDMRERIYTRLVTVRTEEQDVPVVFDDELKQTEVANGLLKTRGGAYFSIENIEKIDDPRFPKESRRKIWETFRDLMS